MSHIFIVVVVTWEQVSVKTQQTVRFSGSMLLKKKHTSIYFILKVCLGNASNTF